jgi:DNA-binding protein H-NS
MERESELSVAELSKQIADLSRQLEKRKKLAKKELRTQIDQLLADNELSIADIYPQFMEENMMLRVSGKGSRGSAKYKDPGSDETWNGRGRTPPWVSKLLQAREISLDEFKKSLDFLA